MWGEPGLRATARPINLQFQLTRPVWGEPRSGDYVERAGTDFNSLAPCGANPYVIDLIEYKLNFNSLAPCGANRDFVSVGNRTGHFNSLAPCGANRFPMPRRLRRCQFQLTRPVWGEPLRGCVVWYSNEISTHSPRVGRTPFKRRKNAL